MNEDEDVVTVYSHETPTFPAWTLAEMWDLTLERLCLREALTEILAKYPDGSDEVIDLGEIMEAKMKLRLQ